MTKFKIGDEVYIKGKITEVDNTYMPYLIEFNGSSVWFYHDERIILAGRVEIKSEKYKFGDEVQIYDNNGEWVDALYINDDVDGSPNISVLIKYNNTIAYVFNANIRRKSDE